VRAEHVRFQCRLVAAEDLLSRKPLPTAILGCNDEVAAAALARPSHGFRVPEDVRCRIDDAPLAARCGRRWTTCRQKMELMGYLAADF